MQVFSENEMLDDVESHIVENLNPAFRLRPYQKESFSRFQFYLDGYKIGYRNFLFFVNSSNIIAKNTR